MTIRQSPSSSPAPLSQRASLTQKSCGRPTIAQPFMAGTRIRKYKVPLGMTENALFKAPSNQTTKRHSSMTDLDKHCHQRYSKIVKAVSINISLSSELAEFARQDCEARAFDSMSEYMRDLIRKRRQEEIQADVSFLEKSAETSRPGDPSETEMKDIYASIKARRKKKHEGRS